MAIDVTDVRPLATGSGKGQRLQENVWSTTGSRPIKADGCWTLGLMIGTLGALNGAHRDLGEFGPDRST